MISFCLDSDLHFRNQELCLLLMFLLYRNY